MTRRVVVVRATGHIGGPLCRELLRAGNLVTVFSRDPDRARHVIPGASGDAAWSPVSLILVRGKRVIPARAGEPGYRFRFPVLDSALDDLPDRPDHATVAAR